jgi:tetraacyldisaccharide 4'-kinase
VRARLERWLVERWYRQRAPAALRPLSALYGALSATSGWLWRSGWKRPWQAPCPVIVVGNLIAGGAGKTPTVIALVQALQSAGWRPGVISRGHGRLGTGTVVADASKSASELGDEPWLIARRTGAPLAVARRRADAAVALLQAHPDVNVLVADDGLQHHALARDLDLWVFDERGVGNGALLPAGPLRQALPARLPPDTMVIYNAATPTTPLPGAMARRTLAPAIELQTWHRALAAPGSTPASATAGEPLDRFRGRPVLALAGMAAPERFFGMLRAQGIDVQALPLPDHAAMDPLPWPPDTPELLCTEKDAAKIDPARCGRTRVWVVGLDFRLPDELIAVVVDRVRRAARDRRPAHRP